ncbi:MAG: T9SS type A sorting domain-containing protein [Flavobacteriia bacterium]|nr:T9SS type A sorting domain-containing protein [Flavobacteriia bacterium]
MFTIFDLQGKSSETVPYAKEIDISHLENGGYILNVQFDNGKSINKLIMKN